MIESLDIKDSSSVLNATYNDEEQVLIVTYVGDKTYEYRDVPCPIWKGLKEADSKGKYIAQNIKNQYKFNFVG